MSKEQFKQEVMKAIEDYSDRAEELYGPNFWNEMMGIEEILKDFVTSWLGGIEPGEQLQ